MLNLSEVGNSHAELHFGVVLLLLHQFLIQGQGFCKLALIQVDIRQSCKSLSILVVNFENAFQDPDSLLHIPRTAIGFRKLALQGPVPRLELQHSLVFLGSLIIFTQGVRNLRDLEQYLPIVSVSFEDLFVNLQRPERFSGLIQPGQVVPTGDIVGIDPDDGFILFDRQVMLEGIHINAGKILAVGNVQRIQPNRFPPGPCRQRMLAEDGIVLGKRIVDGRVRGIPQGVLVFKDGIGVFPFCLVHGPLDKVIQRPLLPGFLKPLVDAPVQLLLGRFLPGLLRSGTTEQEGRQERKMSECQFHKSFHWLKIY